MTAGPALGAGQPASARRKPVLRRAHAGRPGCLAARRHGHAHQTLAFVAAAGAAATAGMNDFSEQLTTGNRSTPSNPRSNRGPGPRPIRKAMKCPECCRRRRRKPSRRCVGSDSTGCFKGTKSGRPMTAWGRQLSHAPRRQGCPVGKLRPSQRLLAGPGLSTIHPRTCTVTVAPTPASRTNSVVAPRALWRGPR